MKILHLASHTGNIGDNISHIGLHNILNQILGNDYTMDNLEIRKSYNIYNGNDRYVLANKDYSNKLIDKIDCYIKNKKQIIKQSKNIINTKKDETLNTYKNEFKRLGFDTV